ncbi:MAG: methylmalonyl-CoA mutase [Chloroflexi bacterium]|nr:methylmalonyl-CoA mutase [Chloroflexota bacterium]
MFDQAKMDEIRRREQRNQTPPKGERQAEFHTASGIPIKQVYTPADVSSLDYFADLANPGEFPFTRGLHPTGYRGKLWTMRMVAGYGSAEESNARHKYLLEHGQTGLNFVFDMPTIMGYDCDAPEARGEFGRGGVAMCSLADMEVLTDGLPLNRLTTSLIINGPAAPIWAMYIAAAEKRGIPRARLGGTLQNDALKEYFSSNQYILAPGPSLKLVMDTFEFGAKQVPLWNTISICGYQIRDSGANAIQEVAFSIAEALAYVEAGIQRGLNVDEFAPRLSFFFGSHNDFFEEIAKFRAARRIWAREMKRRFAASERSQWLRFHVQTSGSTLTAQQPENNVVRVTLQALAAVLGGAQSLHTNALDEALSIPTEKSARIALRTQQIIAQESGAASTVDPLGGSYYVEYLTNEIERQANEYLATIEGMGKGRGHIKDGFMGALQNGYFQEEIGRRAYESHQAIEQKKQVVVGVNEYTVDEPADVTLFTLDKHAEQRHLDRLHRVRRERDAEKVGSALDALRMAAHRDVNLMPYFVEAASAYATLGEMCGVLREVWGEYRAVDGKGGHC